MGGSRCHGLVNEHVPYCRAKQTLRPYRLAGDTLAIQSRPPTSVLHDLERLSRARKRIQMISTLGMFRGGISTEKSSKFFKTFIRPLCEYSIYFTDHTVRIRKECTLVMQDAVQAILGTWARKHTRRLSILCGSEPEKHRRAIFAHNLLRKLEEATDEQTEV